MALRSGSPGRLKPPIENYRESLPTEVRIMLERMGEASAVGSPETVRMAIESFVRRTGADEIVIAGSAFDPAARQRSLRLVAEAVA